jgi:hypothetical protein
MVASGKKVGDEENSFACASEFDGLNVGIVSGNADGGYAGKNFLVARNGVPLAGLLYREKVFLEIAGAVAFGGIGGVGDFGGLDNVSRVWKSGHAL